MRTGLTMSCCSATLALESRQLGQERPSGLADHRNARLEEESVGHDGLHGRYGIGHGIAAMRARPSRFLEPQWFWITHPDWTLGWTCAIMSLKPLLEHTPAEPGPKLHVALNGNLIFSYPRISWPLTSFLAQVQFTKVSAGIPVRRHGIHLHPKGTIKHGHDVIRCSWPPDAWALAVVAVPSPQA